MQVSPPFSRVPKRSARTTRSRSASARTITASSPESSMTDGVFVSASCASTSRPFSEEPVKMTLSTPSAMASRAASTLSGRIVSSAGSSPASVARRAKASATSRVPGAGLSSTALPATSACSACTAGQEERVVSRADHEHDAEWLALHLERNALHPERTPASPAAARREHARGVALQPAAGVGEREDFGDELLGERTIAARHAAAAASASAFSAMR